MLVVGSLAALLAAAMPAGTALAQSDTVVVSGSGIGVMTTSQAQERVAQLEKDYNSVKLAGPRAGLGISSILVAGGAFMVGAGAGLASFDQDFLCPVGTAPCRGASAGPKALAVTGAFVLIGGVAGVIVAAKRLKQRKKERRRVELEISELKRALPPE